MKSRLKTFRWTRFLIAMVVTFAAVIIFGKVVAMDVPGKHAAKAPASAPASAQTAAAPAAAAAADPGVLPSGKAAATQSYYHEVDAIRTDTELVTAQLDNLKAHHELEQAKSGIFKSDTPAATPQTGMPMTLQTMAPSVDSSANSESRTPVVVQTSMVDGHWVASIRLSSGSVVTRIRAGQDVQSVGRVLSISLNDVTATLGKKTYSLPFASDDSAASSAATVPSRGGMTVAPPLGIR